MSSTDGVHLYTTLSGARAAAAGAVLVVSAIYSVPAVHKRLAPFLNDTLSLADVPTDRSPQEVKERAQKWYPSRAYYLALALLSALQVAVWAVAFGDVLALWINSSGEASRHTVIYTGLNLGVWVVLLLRIIMRPPVTPPWSSLVIYILLCASSLIAFADVGYYRFVHGTWPQWSTPATLITEALNAFGSFLLVLLAAHLRMNSPTALGAASVISLDDPVRLGQWISFSWITPFIREWATKEMQPDDLPPLSPAVQTANVFDLYRSFRANSLLMRLFKANYFDLIVDIVLTTVSVFLNYLSPFFLKRILDSLEKDQTSKELRAQAYTFACLALLASCAKAVADLIHLYHGRRGSMRLKSQLVAAIYQKALKRKDTAGVVNKKEDEGAEENKGKVEDAPQSAETGKVVNLMSGDANRIGMTFSIIFFIYSSPIEIVVAAGFLYGILGWSAFAGIVVLIIATPLNTYISKRSYRIQKELLKARDKRMTVVNELISGISFIKFFAWTEKWTQRCTDARAEELRMLVRSNINSVLFSLIWSFVPIFVTLCSFFSYIVIAKQELTVSKAFTSIALFGMLRSPLNAVPTFVVHVLQTYVSVKRVEDFLGESEVPDWVSSLKSTDGPSTGPTKIGFEKATLRWNTGARDANEANGTSGASTANGTNGTSTANGTQAEAQTQAQETTSTSSEPAVFELSNITVDFPIGKLSVVSGPTGAGKTAILVGLLGEMDVIEGKTFLPKHRSQVGDDGLRNSVAYAAQTPWLQQKSIKDNILFGEEMDEERYEAVVEACALRTDFDILEDGDLTEIGDKGVSLSGGQKARVALARAVYSYTQHVLLDDPLAAVDSHTAKHLVDKCLNGPLLKGRTIILVSHHLDLLSPTADFIVRILDGRVDCQGSPSELKRGGELDGVIAIEGATAAKEEPIKAADAEVVEDEAEEVEKEDKKKPRKLVKDEERAVGSVKWATYRLYIKSATMITWVLFFVILIAAQFTSQGERFWLSFWGEAYDTKLHSLYTPANPYHPDHALYYQGDARNAFIFHTSAKNRTPLFQIQTSPNLPSASTHPGFYLAVYSIISLCSATLGILGSIVGYWGSYRAAKTIHEKLLNSVVHGTIRFFNTTPLGRIINRFARDIETVDGRLSGSLRLVITYIVNLIVTVGVIIWLVPLFIIPAAIISFMYYSYTVVYLRTGRSLRRLEATARSPIYSGFAELLDGVISVRAFSVERSMFTRLCEQVDLSNSAFYYYWMTNRWLLIRFDVLGAVAVFITTLLSLSGAINAGSAGIAIVNAQSFVQACYWVSRFWGELEMDFNSLERVEEYLNIPEEPPAVIPGNRPPAYWPSYTTNESFISARDLEIKYAPELPTVFKGSFEIKAGEKIGLIGRTGSGKSTLGMALLRFTDPASGSIWLDGIDITTIGVDDLRSRITYIPQDAVLFSGTIRDNLDPFSEHEDAELIDALIRVNLITGQTPAVSRAPSHARLAALVAEDEEAGSGAATPSRVHITLSSEVSAGGANFSQGQRQLVAMARALLRRSNLIIMDEATASVDFATDEALQRAIRSEFKGSTVITIAHRLSSVIDYDRLLVLADGGIREFDSPKNLLHTEGSLFRSLCEKSGKFAELLKAAEAKGAEGAESTGEATEDTEASETTKD